MEARNKAEVLLEHLDVIITVHFDYELLKTVANDRQHVVDLEPKRLSIDTTLTL